MSFRSIRRIFCTLVITGAAIGIGAPVASAGVTLTPASHNFGNQNVGSTSAPQAFTLTATCDPFPGIPSLCFTPAFIVPNVSTTGDFAQSNNCPPILVGTTTGTPCTIDATFKPTAAGVRNGVLNAGGHTSSLTGTGVVPAGDTKGAIGGKKKKCKKAKKKKSASAAKKKKCKKKKK